MPALAKQPVIAVIGTGAMGAGIAQVVAAAGHPVNLGETYGEDRYRISPLFQHKVYSKKNFHD